MTEQEKMLAILYKAAADGVAKLIKNGLAFTVMAMAIAGLLWGMIHLHEIHIGEVVAMKSDIGAMKKEHSGQLNDLRREIAACIESRIIDAARIARLEALLQSQSKNK